MFLLMQLQVIEIARISATITAARLVPSMIASLLYVLSIGSSGSIIGSYVGSSSMKTTGSGMGSGSGSGVGVGT
jgi:hypothetical protein